MPSPSHFLKVLLRHGGLAFVGRHRIARYLDHEPASAFHDVLLRSFPYLRSLRFIQIGANNGRRLDPLNAFINTYGWHGLMFEPLRTHFAELKGYHGGNPRLLLRQAAVDVSSGRRLVYDFTPSALENLPDWTRGLGSFSRERIEQAAHELGLPDTAIQTEEVETLGWPEVWTEFGPHRCDILALDTEGYDLTLLRSANLARHRPRLILFEHSCNTLDERLRFYGELLVLGYEIATYEGDTVASLPHDR